MTNPPSMPASGGDFDWAAPAGAYAQPPPQPRTDAPETPPAKHGWWSGTKARIAALIAAGAIVGGGAALAVDHSSGSSSPPVGKHRWRARWFTDPASPRARAAARMAAQAESRPTVVPPVRHDHRGQRVNRDHQDQRWQQDVHRDFLDPLAAQRDHGCSSSFKVGDSVFGSTTTSGGSTLNDLMTGTGGGAPGGNGTAPGSGTGAGQERAPARARPLAPVAARPDRPRSRPLPRRDSDSDDHDLRRAQAGTATAT